MKPSTMQRAAVALALAGLAQAGPKVPVGLAPWAALAQPSPEPRRLISVERRQPWAVRSAPALGGLPLAREEPLQQALQPSQWRALQPAELQRAASQAASLQVQAVRQQRARLSRVTQAPLAGPRRA